tara:strand:+ start:2564 stop:5224 length:2661 start_codon:yes stop_codon:yes gene_type:complete
MKSIYLLLLLVVSFDTFAGPGTFPQGKNVKLLKDSLEFKTGITIGKDTVNPKNVATPADQGSLLISNDSLYLKMDDGMTTNWRAIDLPDQTGNAGLALTTSGINASWGISERLNAQIKTNLLVNPSYENSGGLGTLIITGGVDLSGVTSRTLQESPHNASVYDITATAAHTFDYSRGTAEDFTGRQMVAYCEIRTDRDDVFFKVFPDGSTELTEIKVSNSNTWDYYRIPFVGEDSPQLLISSEGNSAVGNTKVDNCFLGVSDNETQKIQGAHFVGSLDLQNNCLYRRSTAGYGYLLDSELDCVETSKIGNVSLPTNTNAAGVKILNFRTDGVYRVVYNGLMLKDSAAGFCEYTWSKDTSLGTNGEVGIFIGSANATLGSISGDFKFEAGDSGDVFIIANIGVTTECRLYGVASDTGAISVHFFPDSKSTIATQKSQSPNYAGFLSFSFMDGDLQGHLPADGRCVAKGLYPNYDSRVANLYGDCDAGTGANTGYNLPDMRGYFPRMVDTTSEGTAGVNPDNTVLGGKQADQNVSHAHTLSGFASRGFVGGPSVIGSSTANTTYNSGSSGGNEARPSAISLMAYVRMADNNLVVGTFEQIRSDDLVKMRYTSNNSQSFGGNVIATIKYEDKESDNFNIYSTTTGIATIPHLGFYEVSCKTGTSAALGTNQTAQVLLETSLGRKSSDIIHGSGAASFFSNFASVKGVLLNQGDTVRCDWFSQAGVNLNTGDGQNFIEIIEQPDFKSTVANLMQGQTTKCQIKVLQANVSGTGNVPSLSFNNLVIGKKYSYAVNVYMAEQNSSSNFKEIGIGIDNGTKRVGFINTRYPVTVQYWRETSGHSRTFSAVSTDLDLGILYNSNMSIGGSTTQDYSFVELCELPETVIETTEFN